MASDFGTSEFAMTTGFRYPEPRAQAVVTSPRQLSTSVPVNFATPTVASGEFGRVRPRANTLTEREARAKYAGKRGGRVSASPRLRLAPRVIVPRDFSFPGWSP